MGIDQISRDMDSVHLRIVNLARSVSDGHTTLNQARQNLEAMTQQMPAESRAVAEGLLARLTEKR